VNDPVLLADASLAEAGGRQAKRDFILDRLTEWSRRHKKEKLVVEAQGQHIPASPVATVLELARDPQLMARSFLQAMDHPDFGNILFPVGAIACVSGVSPAPAPRLGQHTAAILAELGYSDSEAQALRESDAL